MSSVIANGSVDGSHTWLPATPSRKREGENIDAGAVHRARFADHPRRIRSGKTKYRICPALRRSRCTTPGRPDLQPLTHPHRDGHPWTGFAPRDRRGSREDADLGYRMQARVGNPKLRTNRLF